MADTVFNPEEPLAVTSPKMTGSDVKIAQRTLKNNDFGEFYEGEVDGVYGRECGRASLRAKEAIGYRDDQIKPGYGATIHGYLTGDVKLTDAMKERRHKFLLDERKDLRLRALRIARDQKGTTEHPHGSNKTKYGEWFGVNGVFWCAIFVSWCYARAGSVGTFRPGSRHSFCPTVMSWAQDRENGLDQIRNPEPGDIVLFQFDDDSNADHIGIYVEKTGANTFRTIEGNTSSDDGGSQNNGGGVYARDRSMSQVYRPSDGGLGFVRVLI